VRFIKVLYNNYLNEVEHRWFEVGVLLGIPISKLVIINYSEHRAMDVINVSFLLLN
jgi:hypothetical protein